MIENEWVEEFGHTAFMKCGTTRRALKPQASMASFKSCSSVEEPGTVTWPPTGA
jgi:hypothetical protein